MLSYQSVDIQLPENEAINFPIISPEDLKKLNEKIGERIEKFFNALQMLGIEAAKDGLIGGGALASLVLTIGNGWPEIRPALLPPTLLVSVLNASLSSMLSFSKKEEGHEKGHADYSSIMSGLAGFIFLLKMEIAFVVFAKDLRNPSQRVDVSPGEFAAIAITSGLFPTINAITEIVNTHSTSENVFFKKVLPRLNDVANVFTGAGLTHALLSTTASVTGAFKIDGNVNDANAINQFCGYLASLIGGVLLTIGLKLTKNNMARFNSYLNATAITYSLYLSFNELIKESNTKEDKGDATLIIFMWAAIIAYPILMNAAQNFYKYCRENKTNQNYQRAANDDYDSDEDIQPIRKNGGETVFGKIYRSMGTFCNKRDNVEYNNMGSEIYSSRKAL